MANRETQSYQLQQLAYELVTTDMWNKLLGPELERAGKEDSLPPITCLESAIKAARHQAKVEYAAYLKARIERLALTFKDTGNGRLSDGT